MSATEIDEYLSALEEPDRGALETLRHTILDIVPDAEQVISYRVPAFRVRGHTIAGFAASSLHFTPDQPLPRDLVEKLITVRRAQMPAQRMSPATTRRG